jgi:hypothetical protein
VSEVDHRQLGVDCFNDTWRLLESREDDERMLHMAHASRFHWSFVGEPKHFARGEWQISRVYAVLGRAEPSLHHAHRCLEIVEAHPDGMEEFDLPYAHEALARAYAVAGDPDASREWLARAHEGMLRIADEDDRVLLEGDLATVGT